MNKELPIFEFTVSFLVLVMLMSFSFGIGRFVRKSMDQAELAALRSATSGSKSSQPDDDRIEVNKVKKPVKKPQDPSKKPEPPVKKLPKKIEKPPDKAPSKNGSKNGTKTSPDKPSSSSPASSSAVASSSSRPAAGSKEGSSTEDADQVSFFTEMGDRVTALVNTPYDMGSVKLFEVSRPDGELPRIFRMMNFLDIKAKLPDRSAGEQGSQTGPKTAAGQEGPAGNKSATPDKNKKGKITRIVTRGDVLYCATTRGVKSYKGSFSNQLTSLSAEMGSFPCLDMLVQGEEIYMSNSSGVYVYNMTSRTITKITDSVTFDGCIRFLLCTYEGALWFVTEKGLVTGAGSADKMKIYPHFNKENISPRCIAVWDGRFLIATRKHGLLLFNPKNEKWSIMTKIKLSENQSIDFTEFPINSIYVEGKSYWLATSGPSDNAKLMKCDFEKRRWFCFEEDAFATSSYNQIASQKLGNTNMMFAGTATGIVAVNMDELSLVPLTVTDSIDFLFPHNDGIYFTTTAGKNKLFFSEYSDLFEEQTP